MDSRDPQQHKTGAGPAAGAGDPLAAIHERNINVRVAEEDAHHCKVQASFLDLEHNFYAEMRVEIASGRIVEATAQMVKRPYATYCLRALDNVQKLQGEIIGPGISRKVVQLLGRSTGCVHLVEIFQAAIGFTATVLIGKRAGMHGVTGLSEEEDRKLWFPILRNSCQVFQDPDAKQSRG